MASKSKKNQQPHRPRSAAPARSGANQFIWAARFCFAAATLVAAYLLIYTLTEKPMAGCGPGSSCDRVMGSSWAYWLEIPVSAPALAVYATMFICSVAVASRRARNAERAWTLGFTGAVLILLIASWFIYLQVNVIKSLCKYCTTAHALSLFGSILFLAKAPRPATATQSRKIALAMFAVVPFAALVAGQQLAPHKINTVAVYNGAYKFDLREAPLIGNPDAKSFVVDLFDYTCPDCHQMHGHLTAARERMTNSFSIICIPCPLDSNCNPRVKVTPAKHKNACEYARIGLALRRCSSALFQQYDDWFFGQGSTPALDAAREKAATLAGKDRLEKALADPWVNATLQKGVSMYEQNGRESRMYRVPQLIVGDTINYGPMRNVDELIRFLENHLQNPSSPSKP